MEMAAGEMAWLNEKEEIEVSRDWSSQNVSLQELDQHIEVHIKNKHCLIIIF